MAKQDFIPDGDDEFLGWHDHFKETLPSLATKYGLSTQDLSDVDGDNTELHTTTAAAGAKQSEAIAATTTKKVSRKRVEGNSRQMARRVKAHPAYEEADGNTLLIEGPDDSTDLSQSSPVLKLQLTPEGVLVRFVKGVSDGVNIYSKRGAETKATFLARDTNSPYLDSRNNLGDDPEDREYHAVFVKSDQEVGQESATVKITAP